MPLTLVIGPANSAKAQVVFERYRAQLARGPILVVPTALDAAHYARELAGAGVVMGGRVESFAGLMREIAARAGLAGARPLGPGARERVVAAAVADARLAVLRSSAAAPGFLAAATGLVAELGARRIDPPRLTQALRSWAPTGARRVWCDEVAAIYSGYRRRLERLERLDEEQLQSRSLDAVRIDPSVWRRTPVLLYGFDDLGPLQLDAIETLARAADVVISLPYEAGRTALAGRAATFETLRPGAEELVVMPPRAEYYEAGARATLHHLERTVFDAEAARIEPGEGLRLIEGETERGELELVGAELLGLLDGGYRPPEIAVVMRSVAGSQALIGEVFGELGIPVSIVRRVRFADTPVGRGLLGLLAAALADGGVEDLLVWLRAPGVLEHPELADRFEVRLRRAGVRRAAAAREAWEHFPLDGLDRLQAAAARGPGALLERTGQELARLLAAPHRRAADLLGDEARIIVAAERRLAELSELAGADRSLGPSPKELIATLAGLELELPGAPGGVLVCDAATLRARRVRALFVCGLQEGSFPALGRERPFFSAEERAEIARASGLVLGAFADPLAAERYLFYATISRAEARVCLSWHAAGDDGSAAWASGFTDDVRDAFWPAPVVAHRSGAGDALEQTLPASQAPGGSWPPPPVGRVGNGELLALLAGREAESPSSLETWTACPVGWLAERLLGAAPLEPDGEPRARGTVAHAVLARVVAELCAARPAGRASAVGEVVRAAVRAHAGEVSANPERDRAARRRLAADIERYLSSMELGSHVPREFELAFGLPGAAYPAVSLAGGELVVRGRIDRIDVDAAAGTAIVWDYKSGEVLGQAKWAERGRMALGLYMLAAEQLLGLGVVGGLYQPLRGADLRPRGVVRADLEPAPPGFAGDRVGGAEVAGVLDDVLERALLAARELRAGALEPRPATCTSAGVCRHPSICRGLAG